MIIKKVMKSIPFIGPLLRRIFRRSGNSHKSFQGSESYWKNRYETGGNSGDGSFNRLAEFKAEILNAFVAEHGITSVIEFGCGDGNQIRLTNFKKYTGFDISPDAISRCLSHFSKDKTKTFKMMEEYRGETAELALSLDVIYHLIEDNIFMNYMSVLFSAAEKFVVIYSSDTDENPEGTAKHIRHRKFTKWLKSNQTEWRLMSHIPNKYPYSGDTKTGSFADFYIYSKL